MASLNEWIRVLRDDGTLAALTPTALLDRHEDPLTIGSFMEKVEHEAMGEGGRMDGDHLLGLLRDRFRKIEERRIVHIAVFIASEKIPRRDGPPTSPRPV